MRVGLLGLLGFCLAPASLAGQNAAEQKHPDIVYYANAYADHYHVPRALVHAVITQESGWNRNALSSQEQPLGSLSGIPTPFRTTSVAVSSTWPC